MPKYDPKRIEEIRIEVRRVYVRQGRLLAKERRKALRNDWSAAVRSDRAKHNADLERKRAQLSATVALTNWHLADKTSARFKWTQEKEIRGPLRLLRFSHPEFRDFEGLYNGTTPWPR